MANNCLVTKLKSSVNNPSLPVLNGIVIRYKSTEAPASESIVFGLFKYINPTKITFSDGLNHFCYSDGTLVSPENIPNDYGLSGGSSQFIYLTAGDYYITIPDKSSHDKYFQLFGNTSRFIFDLSQISHMPQLENIQMPEISADGITGNISSLNYSINLKSIYKLKNVTGNIDEMVRFWLLNGRTTTELCNLNAIGDRSNTVTRYNYNGERISLTGVNYKIEFRSDLQGYQIIDLHGIDTTTAWIYSGGSWIEDTSI